MIELFNSRSEQVMSFQDYDDLLSYIKEIEHENQKETRLQRDREYWSFTFHSNQRLSLVYWKAIMANRIILTEKEQDAYEGGYDLLEICEGDSKQIKQIILTPSVDIEELKKIWCREYCAHHGYSFIEARH